MKRFFALLLVLLLLPALALGALAADVPEPSEAFYVYDGAGTLSQSTKDLIINASGPLEKYCSGAQIVVVTIDYLPSGYDSEQYANLLFNEWGVGSSQLNNGLLLLHVVMEDRGWLAVGAGLTTQFSTDYVNSLMDEYFWPYSDSGEYDKAVATLFPHLIDEFARIYNTDQLYGGTGGATGGNQGGGYYDDGLQASMDQIYADVVEKAQDLTAQIYSRAQYSVGQADKLDSGDFAVEVTVSPIEVVSLIPAEVYAEKWSSVQTARGITSDEQVEAMSDEDYMAMDAEYGMAMLDYLEELLPQLSYGEEQSIMVQLKQEEDGNYSPVSTGWQKIDEVMIDYAGAYLK